MVSSPSAGGAQFVFADGHVSMVRSVPGDGANGAYTPDGIAFQALGTRANGDIVQGLDY